MMMARAAMVVVAVMVAVGLHVGAQEKAAKNTKAAAVKSAGRVEKSEFGKLPDGTAIESYVLTNAKGMSVRVITYGATVTELHVPDRAGKMTDVVLGFDKLDGYLGNHPYFGGAIGRYANRIAKGKF